MPITKSIWFLKANVQVSVDGIDINGVVTLGCWGYCIGDNCTSSKLGYNLGQFRSSSLPSDSETANRSTTRKITTHRFISYLFLI